MAALRFERYVRSTAHTTPATKYRVRALDGGTAIAMNSVMWSSSASIQRLDVKSRYPDEDRVRLGERGSRYGR